MAALCKHRLVLAAHMLAVLSVRTCARTFTVANDCPYTIWPAMFTGPSPKRAVPNYPAGWEAQPHTSVGFSVPNDWTAGRIWGRTECDFSNDSASGQTCLTGWCIGGLLCNPTTGTGVPPATVAEWTLQGDNNKDYYDVSLVDGFNIPMEITNNAKCSTAECPADLNSLCPSALKGPSNSTGGVVGCQSSCDANLNNDKTNSPDCCTGSYSTAATCPSSGVQYYSFFKDNCPDSYAYAFDESSGTALWQCDSKLNADYTLTFCPSPGAPASDVSTTGGTSTAQSVLPAEATGQATSSGVPSISQIGGACGMARPRKAYGVWAAGSVFILWGWALAAA